MVNPGRKIYVNQINIAGNNKTRDEVVRRELRQMENATYELRNQPFQRTDTTIGLFRQC